MGEAALVTILHANGTIDAFYHRAGGYFLSYELIEYGVDGLIADRLDGLWDREPGNGLEGAKLRLCWATSLLVVDVRQKLLLWDLHDLGIEAPRLVSRLFELTSPGWRAVWCPGDFESVWRYLRSDSNVALYEPPARKPIDFADDYFAPFVLPEFGFGEATLFTADLTDARTACWLSDKNVEYVPHATIAQLAAIAERMTGNELDNFATWPCLGGPENYDVWPGGGVHIDFCTETVWGWENWGFHWADTFPERWPGWRFVELGECWEVHGNRARGRVVREPLRDMILQSLGFWPDGSEMLHHTRRDYYPRERLDAYLRAFLDHDPLLAPAAFLQPDGTICWDPMTLFAQ